MSHEIHAVEYFDKNGDLRFAATWEGEVPQSMILGLLVKVQHAYLRATDEAEEE